MHLEDLRALMADAERTAPGVAMHLDELRDLMADAERTAQG